MTAYCELRLPPVTFHPCPTPSTPGYFSSVARLLRAREMTLSISMCLSSFKVVVTKQDLFFQRHPTGEPTLRDCANSPLDWAAERPTRECLGRTVRLAPGPTAAGRLPHAPSRTSRTALGPRSC